jgi:hypothetical protein
MRNLVKAVTYWLRKDLLRPVLLYYCTTVLLYYCTTVLLIKHRMKKGGV